RNAIENVTNRFTNPSSGLAFNHVTAGAGPERALCVKRRAVHRKDDDLDMRHPLLDLSDEVEPRTIFERYVHHHDMRLLFFNRFKTAFTTLRFATDRQIPLLID